MGFVSESACLALGQLLQEFALEPDDEVDSMVEESPMVMDGTVESNTVQYSRKKNRYSTLCTPRNILEHNMGQQNAQALPWCEPNKKKQNTDICSTVHYSRCVRAAVCRTQMEPRRRNCYNRLRPITYMGTVLVAGQQEHPIYVGGSGALTRDCIEALSIELLIDCRGGLEGPPPIPEGFSENTVASGPSTAVRYFSAVHVEYIGTCRVPCPRAGQFSVDPCV